MNNFLFEDTIDGGFFFVQCDTEDEAYEIIWEEIACCPLVAIEIPQLWIMIISVATPMQKLRLWVTIPIKIGG